jgi:mRNA interferase RelE/StbE
MKYSIQFKPRAVKDIESLKSKFQSRIINKIEEMSDNLKGDVKHLTNSTPEFRLRVGDYRVLFEIEDGTIIVYRIRHRKEAYR